MASFTLSPVSGDEAAGVICSFDSRWHDAIHDGTVKVVFRKKRLTGSPPEWLYVYLATPISSITAKAQIESAEVMPLMDAIKLAGEGNISAEELRKYAGTAKELFVMRIGNVAIAREPQSSEVLGRKFSFFPSPNFMRVSREGVKTLDELACFSELE